MYALLNWSLKRMATTGTLVDTKLLGPKSLAMSPGCQGRANQNQGRGQVGGVVVIGMEQPSCAYCQSMHGPKWTWVGHTLVFGRCLDSQALQRIGKEEHP